MRYHPFSIPRTKEEFLLNVAIGTALQTGFNTAVTYVINQNLKMHYRDWGYKPGSPGYRLQSYRTPHIGERMGATVGRILVSPATPVVGAAVAVAAVSAATAVAYEMQVNRPIRKGTKGTFFGPYASGFGTVV